MQYTHTNKAHIAIAPRIVELTVAVAALPNRVHERAGRAVKHLHAMIVHVAHKDAVGVQCDAPRSTQVRRRAAVLVGETDLRVGIESRDEKCQVGKTK